MPSKKILLILLPLLVFSAIVLGYFQREKISEILGLQPAPTYLFAPSADSLEGYYQKSRELGQTVKPSTQTVTFLAVGDIMLSRNVAGSIKKSGDDYLPFRNMESILRSTNFNFGNLESPLSGSNYFNPTGSLVFNAPPKYINGLSKFNFTALNLANNHALDQGVKGLDYTLQYLDGLGIAHTGAGLSLQDAWKPARVTANALNVCFVGASYSSVNDNGKTTNNYVARIETTENLKFQIENSKSLCDFVVATMHAGTEYTRQPNEAQTTFARAAIDFGADMVIGAHPHWVQTIENYKGKYIFYSLGNFIFDQMWSQDTREGLTIKISLSKEVSQNFQAPGAATADDLQGGRKSAEITGIELIPIVIENYSTPRPATTDEAKKILEKIGQTTTILK